MLMSCISSLMNVSTRLAAADKIRAMISARGSRDLTSGTSRHPLGQPSWSITPSLIHKNHISSGVPRQQVSQFLLLVDIKSIDRVLTKHNRQPCLANTPSTFIRPGLCTDSLRPHWEPACGFSYVSSIRILQRRACFRKSLVMCTNCSS